MYLITNEQHPLKFDRIKFKKAILKEFIQKNKNIIPMKKISLTSKMEGGGATKFFSIF